MRPQFPALRRPDRRSGLFLGSAGASWRRCGPLLAVLAITGFAGVARATDSPVVIFVNTAPLDEAPFPNMSDADTAALKAGMVAEIQAKFDAALGPGVVTVTNDPAREASASRRVVLKDEYGMNSRGDLFYGGWSEGKNGQPGSETVFIYLSNFADFDQDHYKTNEQWDVSKLKRSLAATASHELAHTFSVGHNLSNDGTKTLMKEGPAITPAERATVDRGFDETFVRNTLKNNIRTKPCVTAQNFTIPIAVKPVATATPQTPHTPEDVGSFTASLASTGPLASSFSLGWYGEDSDDGEDDGDSDYDIIYKSSLGGLLGIDAPWLTFFESQHASVQFLLRGDADTPYAGMWFPMDPALLTLGNPVTTPDGRTAYQLLTAGWNVDGQPGVDVQITLNASGVYGDPASQFNGWTTVPSPAAPLSLALGAIGLCCQRRRQPWISRGPEP